jgi:hypothetical protein
VSPYLVKELHHVEAFNGFGNRFLWFAVCRRQLLPFGGAEPPRLDSLADKLAEIATRCRSLERVGWTDAGTALWKEVYPDVSADRPGVLGAITARAEAHVVRLALIYALADEEQAIDREHLEAALALWEYSARCAAFIFGDALGNADADRTLEALRAAGPDGLSQSEIRSDVFQNHITAARLKLALDFLLWHRLIERRVVPTAGRHATRWCVIGGKA